MSYSTDPGPDFTDSAGVNFYGVHVAGTPINSRYDIHYNPGDFLVRSLCHPHIHLDKAFLLQHPKYADLKIEKGDFAEAMRLTSEAKSRFEFDDIMERGRALIQESIHYGVTHMRAFVEVDSGVQMKCLDAGLALKEEFKRQCHIQICVFAQDPIYSYDDGGQAMIKLLESAASRSGVEAFGSTPYVETNGDFGKQVTNMEFAIKLAMKYKLHLDFHIDYNLDPKKQTLVLQALDSLHRLKWPANRDSTDYRSIVFGHCTRLTLFHDRDWQGLKDKIKGLPISFVALPTSDIFMMGRPTEEAKDGQRVRGTLQVLEVSKKHNLNVVIGVNNVGNAFTPQGSCDPLSLASLGVGLYQAGTKQDADLLLQCVSNRAKTAIGITLSRPLELDIDHGDPADFVIFHNKTSKAGASFRARETVQDHVYDPIPTRTTVYNGVIVSDSRGG